MAEDLYPLDMTCGTCHCERRWHFKTYGGDSAGCTRKIGTVNPILCPCIGFMATEAESLREAHLAELGRATFRAVVARQDAKYSARYRAALP